MTRARTINRVVRFPNRRVFVSINGFPWPPPDHCPYCSGALEDWPELNELLSRFPGLGWKSIRCLACGADFLLDNGTSWSAWRHPWTCSCHRCQELDQLDEECRQ